MRNRCVAQPTSRNRPAGHDALLDVEHHGGRHCVLSIAITRQRNVYAIGAGHEQQLWYVTAKYRPDAQFVMFIASGRCGAVEGRDWLAQRIVEMQ